MNCVRKLIEEVTVDIKKLSLNPEKTAIVNIDIIGGFFLRGALASPRLEKIIPKIEKVNDSFAASRKVFFIDSHSAVSAEFTAYPAHCVNDEECRIIPEMGRFLSDAEVIKRTARTDFSHPITSNGWRQIFRRWKTSLSRAECPMSPSCNTR